MTPNPSRLRIAGAGGFFLLLFSLVVLRAVQLTLVQGDSLRELAGRQQYQRVALRPERGPIVDRNGEQLAVTVEAASIFLRPREFHALPLDLGALARVLGADVGTVEAKGRDAAPFVWLKRRVSRSQQAAVERLALPGVGTELSTRRIYPHGTLAAPLLGFTNVDGQGIEGLELKLNDELQGEGGAVVVERDARGRRMLTEGVWRPLPRRGARVELTIDAALQHVVELELERGVTEQRADSGTAVALDPSTGEILALAQAPAFDPNTPDPTQPDLWRNRVITDSFEPGSTMKAFVAAAALEGGFTRPEERLFCENGHYAVGRRTIRDHEPYGWLTFAEVIQHSSNICTAKIGERMGRERLGAALQSFGFGRTSGIDLVGEVPGIFRPIDKWGRIHVVTTSFGQGISVTLMQLVRAFGALANGGRLMRPYVVRRVVSADGRELAAGAPEVVGRPITPATARLVTTLLEAVVDNGTATRAQIEGIRVAGKTGTAQKVDPRTHAYSARARISSFVGYAPAEDPRIVIGVVLDNPKSATYGGLVAAPVFKRIAEYALESMGIQRRVEPAEAQLASTTGAARPVALTLVPSVGGVPSVIGLGMRDAVARIDRAGLKPQIEGWGVVVTQEPPPGAQVEAATPIRLQFGSALQ